MKTMTGISNNGVLDCIQNAIMDKCLKNPPLVGGHQKVVQIDETEVGKRRKEVKGRPSNIKMDVLTVLVLVFK